MMKRINETALCALLAALGTVLLYAGSIPGKLDIAAAVVSSVCVAVACLETGYRKALLVYAVISVISLLLLPQKTAGILFAVFFGYYPVVKTYTEWKMGVLKSYIVKYAFLNAAVILMLVAAQFFVKVHIVICAAVLVLSNAVLPVYDLAVSKLIKTYEEKFRK